MTASLLKRFFTPTFLNDVLVLCILAFYIFICLVIVFINLFTWHFGNVELILVIWLSNYFLRIPTTCICKRP